MTIANEEGVEYVLHIIHFAEGSRFLPAVCFFWIVGNGFFRIRISG